MKHPIHSRTLPLMFVLGALASGSAHATVLLFDQTRNPATGVAVEPIYAGADLPQDYGDRVAGSPQDVTGGQYTYGNAGEGFTPNVEVAYSLGLATGAGEVQMWISGYGGLTNVIFGTPGSQRIDIQFTADPGYSVLLHGFDLAGYPGADYTINGVAVLEGSNTLFSQSNVLVGGDGFGQPFTHFDFSTPLAGSSLTLQIDYSNIASGQQDNIGLDNLRFSQFPSPVPEPSAWVFFLAGCGLLGWVARRRTASFYS
jgi:hypothetical protein